MTAFTTSSAAAGDVIKTAGTNVAPREVEAAIADMTGLVAHVVGGDDVERGQLVAALIRSSERSTSTISSSSSRQHLSAYKVPRKIIVVSDADVPMMSSGKLDVRGVKDLLRDA